MAKIEYTNIYYEEYLKFSKEEKKAKKNILYRIL